MERVNRILQHPTYIDCLEKIRGYEEERIFCGHDMTHFLDVARLAYLFSLEEGLKIEKEWIYAAGLLHDIGRHVQYRDKTPHQKASVPIADGILTDCGFELEERRMILTAIIRHRDSTVQGEKNLAGIIYRADKMSRSCFGCQAEAQCDWSPEKKNLILKY
ncbi:HD domain-containing protein [Lactonifactor longoviformis]|uniref:HD domain-containing protein n=1 Tax=Lactonifactor TaxID=420345 RepID=UPI0012AF23FD|nr:MULTISPECIES: HD domain-containing protein [Lactonifactor]MCB5714565.1 HD domain-containing protein [Lactonifactor longoviformis]MCB5718519.1 HD domain-containing protein [Lactonifactor longoviformis]MCQ4672735.1 HD domain-containing protein [Lactonifactor longoviformis]MSA02734.1 HD domain-containing protein [Lactonifactor sp. BIOML-A5]MSA09309.1 HD domain-containing protein [Lactonifactor sp. BIOML-A4]